MTSNPGALRRFWTMLNKPSAKYSILAISVVSFIVGILFWGGFHTGLEMTNSLEFCTTCHEMRDNVSQEYKQTIHYSNRTGVPATSPAARDWARRATRRSGPRRPCRRA